MFLVFNDEMDETYGMGHCSDAMQRRVLLPCVEAQ